MSVNKVLNRILSRDDVYDVFIIDGPTAVHVEIEELKNQMIGCRYVNRALSECRSKDLKVCVFSKNFLERPTDMLTVLVDNTGEVYGHDVPQAMPNERIKDGAVWVTGSFVVYPDLMPKSELRFEVLPHSVSFIGEGEGVRDVIAYNPSRAADLYLRNRFGFNGPRNATSTIIGMDFL